MKKIIIFFLFACAVSIFSTEVFAAPTKKDNIQSKRIVVNLAACTLTFYENGNELYVFPVAVGAASTPTPIRKFKITEKEENPIWKEPKTLLKIVSGPMNPLGYRWIGLADEYGIHGTNVPSSIGTYASHGCIRMYEEDVETIYPLCEIGMPVETQYKRVVIGRNRDGITYFRVYPDEYGIQSLTVADINKILQKSGLTACISEDEIAEKLEVCDGEPAYFGRTYTIEINNLFISGKMVEKNGKYYLPASQLSKVLKQNICWNVDTGMVATVRASVPGFIQNNVLLVEQTDVNRLFNLKGEVKGYTYFLTSI